MKRRIVPIAVMVALVPAMIGWLAPAANAGVQPAGSCTYQTAGAEVSLSPVGAQTSLAQASAQFGQNNTVPPSSCTFTISGVFQITGAPATSISCLPSDATSGVGGEAECSGYGLVGPPSGIYGMIAGFNGTIRAVNDGVAEPVSCAMYFDSTGSAFCFFGNPETVHTL